MSGEGFENQPTASISGNSLSVPDPFGHSISKVLLTLSVTSKSASTANAVTIFPPDCFTGGRATRGPSGTGRPISSTNSRRAAAQGSSSSVCSPLGIDHAASSLRAQNGPPGWPIRTSTLSSTIR
jgi:hypothetical protein